MRVVKLGASIADNGSARRCYERCGFVPYGIEPLATCVEGKYYDEVLMSLRLD
jgi:RimJ/RimL family protein N-acetyltransferase